MQNNLQNNPYELLSKRVNGAYFTAKALLSESHQCPNGTCPAILQKGNDTVIIGHQVKDAASAGLGEYRSLLDGSRIAVVIGKELMYRAVEQLSEGTAVLSSSLGNIARLDSEAGCALMERASDFVVIAPQMTKAEVAEMESHGEVGVYEKDGEAAVKIPTPLFAKAVEDLLVVSA